MRVFDNNFRGRATYLNEVIDKIEFIQGDITDPVQVKNAVKDIDSVYHLAAINGTELFYKMPDRVLAVNTKGTINVLESLENSNVKKFIFFSSSETYGSPEYFPTDEKHKLVIEDPSNPRFTYSGSKILGEIYTHTYCKKFNIDYSSVRPHNIYGPRMGYEHVLPQFIKRVVKNEQFTVQGDGMQTRSFCYISDAIDLLLTIGKTKTNGEAFNVGNDKEEVSIKELIQILAKVAEVNLTPKFVELPKGGTLRRKPDINKARKLLGYEPKVTLEEGVRFTYDWYKKDILG